MKKLFLSAFVLFQLQLGAQIIAETEPNNGFATANVVPTYPAEITGDVGGADAVDYFKPNIDIALQYWTGGNIVVLLTATNNSATPKTFTTKLYNHFQQAGLFATDNASAVAPGATISKEVRVCSKILDSIYIEFSTDGNFSYQYQFYIGDPQNDIEPNNTRPTASVFTDLNTSYNSIRYETFTNVNYDTVDYHKVILDAPLNDGTITVEAKNTSCFGGKWLMYHAYKNNSNTPFAVGYVGNTSSVPQWTEVQSAIQIPAGFVANDSIIVRFSANGAFGYELTLGSPPPDYYDQEDNCCYYNAVPLLENLPKSGNVGLYDYVNDTYLDEFDTYRIITTEPGTITLNVEASHDDCNVNEVSMHYDILDKWGSTIYQFEGKELINWYWDGCSTIKTGSITLRGFAADTMYVRLWSRDENYYSSPVSYQLSYSFSNPATRLDVEPNDVTTQSTLITPGQVVKGNVEFFNSFDTYDYYKINLPKDGNVNVIMKSIMRYDENSYFASDLYLSVDQNNYSNSLPILPAGTVVIGDQLYIDTFSICGLQAGTAYLRLATDAPFEYEFTYTLSDTIAWPNDAEYNNSMTSAIPVLAGQNVQGKIGFRPVGFTEDYIDYFRVITPRDGTVKVFIEAINRTCASVAPLNFRFRDKTNFSSGVDFSSPVGSGNVAAGATVLDTMLICGVAADTNWIVLDNFGSSAGKYAYRFRYELVDTVHQDLEPNNSTTLATFISTGVSNKGSVGYKKDGGSDNFDFYKFAIATTDTIRIPVKATNKGCSNNSMQVVIMTKNQSWITYRDVGNATVPPGQTVIDTFKFFANAPDTFFVRIYSNYAFAYDFGTTPQPPSSAFVLSGDTTACIGTYIYKALNIVDTAITYNWSLPQGGGILTINDSVATVQWNQNANRTISLYLSNAHGNSATKQLNVIISGTPPTQVPLVFDFARSLSVQTIPAGAYCQWYRNNILIPNAVEPLYYAAFAGTYTVKYVNDCGVGPVSNSKIYPADAVSQSITLPHTDTIAMSPAAKVILQGAASSGLLVNYSLISGPGTIVYDTLRINGVGKIILRATQIGNDIYSPATPKDDTIVIKKGNQVISFDSIPTLLFSTADPYFLPSGSTTANFTPYFSIVSGNATVTNGWRLNKTGVGTIVARASHPGTNDYNAAIPVDRTFCITINALPDITGETNPCLATYRYNTLKVPGANFVWTLSGGGILTTNKDTAWVQWQTAGNHTLKVKAISPCDTAYTNEVVLNIATSNSAPDVVSNMLPANNAQNQQLPLTLSWIPGSHTVNYDLYIWDSSQVQPGTPYKTNISTVNYTLPLGSFAYNTTYKWRIVAKNPCHQTFSPVQHFRLIPLPDLVVSNIQFPASANSGQTISISWKVTNNGPGNTLTTQNWKDAVLFSFDTLPNFQSSPNWDPFSWTSLTGNGRPLLAGTKQNLTALNVGQSYTNSVSFTLPLNYSQPLYVYVITDYQNNAPSPLQITKINDTLRGTLPMNVVLSPTPDLRVDSVFAPTSAFSGSAINLSYRVKNYGFVTPPGISWSDSVFISQNPLFDRQQCIPVELRNAKDQYYPNMVNAHANMSTQVNRDSSYSKNLEVIVPNKLFGTWFIYVKANAKPNSELYEGALTENNVNKAQIQLYLTPTPKLVVQDFILPFGQASITQPIGVNWNVKNEGFYDNLEKNQGHHLHSVFFHCPCYNYIPNSVCQGPPVYNDSTSWGSSYWIDRVYLSANPSALILGDAVLLNDVKHGIKQFSGIDYILWNTCANIASGGGAHNTETAIKPNSNFPASLNFVVPANLAEGNYYVYVYTNPTKTVFEYPGTAQIKRSSQPVYIRRPDITVSSVTVPAAVNGASNFSIQYTINNSSTAGIFNHLRRDKIYVSNFSSFDGSAQLIATKTYTQDIPANGSVSNSLTYAFAANTSGARYFYIHINYDSAFTETNYTNNIKIAAGATTIVSAALPNDLIVTSATWPDTLFTMKNNFVKFAVKNNGVGTASGSWTDSLFVSCSPTFNRGNSIFLTKRTQVRTLFPDSSYRDSFYVDVPKYGYELNACFPTTGSHTAYFFIKANADTAVYESNAVNNNMSTATAKVFTNSLVDLIVKKMTGADTATVGRPLLTNYTIQNIGYKPPHYYYYGYYDGVYISPDSVFNGNAVLASQFLHYATPGRFDTVNFSRQPIIPNVPTGNYYVLVKTNSLNNISGELIQNNNFNVIRNAAGSARKIHIIRPNLPDLKDSIVFASTSVAAGQPIRVIRKVTNIGTGPTYPTNYGNDLYLSADYTYQIHEDLLIANTFKRTVLNPGESYHDTVDVNIRLTTIPGNYVLIDRADANSQIVEPLEANNFALSNLNVFTPPQVDLLVERIIHPDTVLLGYTMDTAKWVVRNASANTALGNSADGIYLSTGTSLDASATLMAVKNKTLNIAPTSFDTVRLAPMIQNVVEGNYNVIVKTDLLDNISETDKTNNIAVSATQVYVKVKQLPMNANELNTLQSVTRFYKLLIPDSLIGSTIRVTLTSNDSLTMRNEMFIAGGYVPTAANYEYKFETPNYGNQQIIITSVNNPVYYIMIKCVSPNPVLQQIKLRAVKLPFAVLNVQTNSGGNIGNVTVRISGSLFRDSMVAKLRNAGTTITASAIYFTNSTQVYATFNLQGKPLGLYDVVLQKPDASEAILANGFSIVPANNGGLITGSGPNTGAGNGNEPGCDPGAASGLNSQLVVSLNIPERVLITRPIVIQINYSNPTNFDLPVQSRILYSEAGMKLAFTREGVPTGSTSLYVELSEPDGPPGIIRAGGSGTITVHSIAPSDPPPAGFVNFRFK
ncbi:MAG: hypothetical protein H7Y86_05480 [Rhizobacter sp.]|nr:hypothetical protein [Ferruginibacter sp.]